MRINRRKITKGGKWSEDELEIRNDAVNFCTAIANTPVTEGKWYYEVNLASEGLFQIGWTTDEPVYNEVRLLFLFAEIKD